MALPLTVGRSQALYPGVAGAIVPLAHDLWELFDRRLEGQSYAAGSLLYAPATDQLGALGAGATGTVLGLTNGIPAWRTPSTYLAHALLSATHSDTTAAAVVRGDIITGQGGTPTWARLALGAVGTILRSNGTELVYTTATFPNTAAQGDLFYASAANAWAGLAIGGAGGILVVNAAANAPAWVALGGAGAILAVNAAATQPSWVALGGAGALLIVNAGATQPAWLAAGTNNRLLYMASGAPAWTGTGLTWDGTTLTANAMLCSGAIEIDGALNHDGTTVGLYGATPVTQPAAYTQTYATADRTLSAYTPDGEGVAYTAGAPGADLCDIATVPKLADLNALRVAYENLRAFVEDLAGVVNSLVDDHQSTGLCAI